MMKFEYSQLSMPLKYFLCLMLFLCSILSLYAENPDAIKKYKYDLAICAIFKNEAKYLKKWIDHHHIIGVEHFYLYNVGSDDSFQEVLAPYIRDRLVTLINWPDSVAEPQIDFCSWELCTQVPAYENAVNFIAKNSAKWLVFVDIDEFLISPNGDLKSQLKEYENFSGVALSTINFDGSTQVDLPRQKFTEMIDSKGDVVQIVNKGVEKMIFKPHHCVGFFWPPYKCRFKTDDSTTKIDKQKIRINRYPTRDCESISIEKREQTSTHNSFVGFPKSGPVERMKEETYVIESQRYPIDDEPFHSN